MSQMKGLGLWEEVEKQARIQQGVNETWSAVSIMLLDGKAYFSLKHPDGVNEIRGNIEIPLTEEISA